ncbi:dihydropteroate synthase [Pontimonas sp.]|uniref:dihydropteroate synthase n=1 Tax=Pontimonas sp. TaxID=2304492 RepID=UPI002870A1FA|nr:dihydropteroate synthase [Pontimonas sp.]MDR9434760.1 dihydropteroate synthase [Pontimonas sp.]
MSVQVPALWGVLNVTPDSFSDGGLYLDAGAAIARGVQMAEEGASVIDVGAESTRPGATRIDQETEIARLEPVVRGLVLEGIRVSVDTMRAEAAMRMVDCGAAIINDVSGGQADPDMCHRVATAGVDYVLMHWRGHSDQMDSLAHYGDVVTDVTAELGTQRDKAVEAGIDPERITLDPGIGFAKDASHNWELLRTIEVIAQMGHGVLVGASRKRFLGALLPEGHSATERDGVSVALSVALAGRGVTALRVHEPRPHREALEVWQRVQRGGQ